MHITPAKVGSENQNLPLSLYIVIETNLSKQNVFRYLKQTFSNFTFIVSLKLFHKSLKDKMNMYIHLSETTIKTILETVLKTKLIFFHIYNL